MKGATVVLLATMLVNKLPIQLDLRFVDFQGEIDKSIAMHRKQKI